MHLIRTKPPGMQASINRCLSQTRTNWEGCGRKGIRRKIGQGDGDGGEVSLDGVAPTRTVGASVSIIVPCSTKSRNNDDEKGR